MKTFISFAILIATSFSACVKRPDAISRAMEWVNAHVPYDANKYTDGYVQGCMGIVGYAWLFPKPGVYSGDLASTVCKRTTKSEL